MHLTKFNLFMRTKAKWFLVGICVIIMITWLVLPYLLGRETPSRMQGAKVYGKSVSPERLEMIARSLRLIMPARTDEEAKRVYAMAIETVIFEQEAKRYGVSASDEDIDTFLKRAFGSAGGKDFDEQMYLDRLQQFRLTRKDFEDSMRAYLTGQLLQETVIRSISLPDEEAWFWYSRENEQVKAAYIQIAVDSLMPLVKADESELRAFYTKYEESNPKDDPKGIGYQEPKLIKIEYILAPYDRYGKQAVITEQQIAAYYEANKARFRVGPPPGAKLPDVETKYRPLTEVSGEIEKKLRDEEAQRLAGDVLKDVNQEIATQTDAGFGAKEVRTADFAAIARKFGLEYGKSNWFSAESWQQALPGAFSLTEAFKQSVSSIGTRWWTINADSGRLIYQITEMQEPRPYPFEKVRAQVETDYRRQQALTLASELASEAAKGAKTLDAASARLETLVAARLQSAPAGVNKDPKSYFSTQESSFFTRPRERGAQRDAWNTGLPGNHGDFAHTVFALKEGQEVSTVTEGGKLNNVFLVARVATRAAEREAFEKDKETVSRDYLVRKQMAELNTWLADIRRRANPSPEARKFLDELEYWKSGVE